MTQAPPTLAHFNIEASIVIRLARYEDLRALEWNDEMWAYRELFENAYEDAQRGRRLMLIADMQGHPVGRLFVQVCPGNFYYADGVTRGYLYSLHVIPFLQGLGIGTRMIQVAESELSTRGFQWVTIAVNVENVRARLLYERLGYQVFRQDNSQWTYRDPNGRIHEVKETCWALKKQLKSEGYLQHIHFD